MMLALSFALTACEADNPEIYTDDSVMEIQMKNAELKILQITDLHLTYGIDSYDHKTFKLIESLVNSDDYDLVVITGDMTLSPFGPSLFAKLLKFMESLKTNWTFVFGNHENDYADYIDYLNVIKETDYLYFKVGPDLDAGGFGNYQINFLKDDSVFYSAYFLDSHAEGENSNDADYEYGYLSVAQVAWYQDHVANDTTDSVMFMHIPLIQYNEATTIGYTGIFDEDRVYPQGLDTGMFDALVAAGKTKGVFVGHDHLNDFSFTYQGIFLAYGQVTGYNAYGNLERGGRAITVSDTGVMSSSIILESDVVS